MSKYNKAIEVLVNRMMEIGGELYAIELTKEDEKSAATLALFGGFLDIEGKKSEFKEITEAIKTLKEAGSADTDQG